ncbi:MAG TPA: glycoside hydrolase family 16 protein [Candidatus Limnocylindrales bacterium]|nr:glycoside hydrolase family 16 protein [Candidatus Limnocylindrales bacterium]
MRIVAILAALVLAGVVLALGSGGPAPPHLTPPPAASDSGNATTTSASDAVPSAPPTTTPRLTPLPSGYTFYDDFDGDALSPSWIQHFDFDGIENTWASSQAAVKDGVLSITASRAGDGWVSQLLDTKTTWTQRYGRFDARMKLPRGKGLWPAFWSYAAGNGREAEIDTMEVCANPVGANDGNDVSLLHNTVRWVGGQDDGDTRGEDLSLDFHVYAVDWRPDHVAFFLDDREVWRFIDREHIPDVPLPLIVNLAVGGSWCGPSDATTPDGAALLVDWIRARE